MSDLQFTTALVIPAAYHSAKSPSADEIATFRGLTQVVDGSDLEDEWNNGLRTISRGTAILLLVVYVAYLNFQLRTHAYLYNETNPATAAAAAQGGARRFSAARSPEPVASPIPASIANGQERAQAAIVSAEEKEEAMMNTGAAALGSVLSLASANSRMIC